MNRTVKGILGGIICGLLSSLPWILVYVYGEWLFSALAIPIALGVDFGYRKFGGTVDKKLPNIISITTIAIVIIVIMIICPIWILAMEGFPPFETLGLLYAQGGEYLSSVLKDLLVSVVFALLGISGVVAKVKNEVDPDAPANPYEIMKRKQELNKNKFKKLFEENNALDKNSAIDKEKLNELIDNKEMKQAFNSLRLNSIIQKYKGKYYFSEKAESSPSYRFFHLYFKIMLIVVAITAIVTIALVS